MENQSSARSPRPADLSTVGGFSQQSPESDGVRDGGQVNVEHGREALGVQGVREVAGVPRGLPAHVLDKAPKQPPARGSSAIRVPAAHSPLPFPAAGGASRPAR